MWVMGKGSEMTNKEEEGGAGKEETGAGSSVRTGEMLLRVLPMGLCLGALVVMLKNSQSNDFGSVSYADIGAFKYLVYANAACATYSLLSAFYTAMPPRLQPSMSRAWTLFLFDQLLTYVILAAGTVSTEILYLAYNGAEKVTWSRECGIFPSFCRKASTSAGITFAAAACYVLLSLLSSYRLFSTYHQPIPFLTTKPKPLGVAVAAFPHSPSESTQPCLRL